MAARRNVDLHEKSIIRSVLGILAILAGGGWYGYRFFKQLPERQERVATTKVQRGDVVIRAYLARRTARGALGDAVRPQPVRHRAGDATWRRWGRWPRRRT